MQELFSLFMTHRINVMHALVKFHEYIPYSLGVMARTRLTTLKCLSIGTPKTINFPFVSNEKLMIFRCPNIQAHDN